MVEKAAIENAPFSIITTVTLITDPRIARAAGLTVLNIIVAA